MAITTLWDEDYIAARKAARRPGATLTERRAAEQLAARIALQAANLDSPLDEIALDEQARRELYPTQQSAKPRVVGYTVTGLPIYG